MLIIWGFKRYVTTLAMLTLVCGHCQRPSAHPLRKLVTKFTLFWIPLFPTSTKYALQCTFCGYDQYLPKEEAERLQAQQVPAGPAYDQQPQPQPQPQSQPQQLPPSQS